MLEKLQFNLTQSEKKLLMRILSSFLEKSEMETESAVIKSILAKLNSKDKFFLYIDGAAMPDLQGAGVGGVCYKTRRRYFPFQNLLVIEPTMKPNILH